MNFEKAIAQSLDFNEYLSLIKNLVEQNKTTGDTQTENLVAFTKLNISRMERIYKTTQLGEEIKAVLSKIEHAQTWVVLTEGWCGDAAQSVPAIAKIADASDMVNLAIISRDDNPDIMDAYLTNGAKSIPKVILLNEDNAPFADWGPRPKAAQDMMLEYKKLQNETYEEFQKRLQLWYNKDKTNTIQHEFAEILSAVL